MSAELWGAVRRQSHQHCPGCGDEVVDVDYAARWPWPGSCSCMKPTAREPVSVTGCECHESCNESWFEAHFEGEQVKDDE